MSETEAEGVYQGVLQQMVALVGSGWTENDALNAVGEKYIPKYRGSFPYDAMPALKAGESAIINQDRAGNKGIHWMAVYKRGTKLYGYDSYGRSMNRLMQGLPSVVNDTEDKEQSDSENNCGARALAWLYCVHTIGFENSFQI